MDARAAASVLETTLPSEAAAEADRKAFAVPAVRNAVLERVRTFAPAHEGPVHDVNQDELDSVNMGILG